jgi:hypothetical protein
MRICLFFLIVLSNFRPGFAEIFSSDERNELRSLINNSPLKEIISGVQNILNNMKERVGNKKPEIIKKLDLLSQQSEPGDNFYERYGSVAGNEYFQMYYREFIEPVLSEFLTIISTGTILEEHRPQLYYGIVKWLGQERALVAYKTSTINADQFGHLLNDEYLMDPVFHDSFPNWNQAFRLAVLEDIKNNWEKLNKIIIKNEQKDFVYPVKIDALPKEESFLYRNKKFKYGFKCIEFNDQSWGMCNKLKWYITIIDPSEDPLHVWITLEIYSYKAFQYTTFAEFQNALLATDKDKSRSIGIEVVHPLYAAIGNRSPEDSTKEVEKLVTHGLTTILSETPLSEDRLKEELAKLLRFFSVTSTFRRGQAAITDWLLKSLASARGYELTFSDKWRGPKFPNPDMHALMEFDIETLIRNFKANTELKPTGR